MIKSFLNEINNVKNQKHEVLMRMRNSSLPLIIYGTGGYATGVLEFLSKQNIKIALACIDNDFIKKSDDSFFNLSIKPLEEIHQHYDSFNVVIGFADYKLAENNLKNIIGCNEVFFLDSTLGIDFFDYDYVNKNIDAFLETYNLLEDQLSKETMISYINAKISSRPDELYNLVQSDQYFPADIIKLSSEEIFVDAGAFDGDTILKFLNNTKGRYKKIYAFEPDKVSFDKLQLMTKEKEIKQIVLFNKGTWKDTEVLKFNVDSLIGARSSISLNGTYNIDVDTIDNLIENKTATYIKMDIEGAELEALNGAVNTIKYSRPKLAICMYHKPEDLIKIPQLLNNLGLKYKFYLRHHLYITHELVLYAVYN